MAELQNNLPPGWESKIDLVTGKRYYINHKTKTTTWEDPRFKHKGHGSQNSEYIPLQHGTPDTRRNYIYPSQPSPKPAFQTSGQYSPKYIPLKELRPNSRTSSLLRTPQTQESSLTSAQDTDESVAKISAMFPTVSDTHIRLLLKKYMKSIFPKAEETIILDVLTSNENNIQKASDCLKSMGYERRDPVKLLQQQEAEAKREEEARAKQDEAMEKIQIPLVPSVKTAQEKDKIKRRLQEQYQDISEQIITIALDSVQYDETKASQILEIMVQEDNKPSNGNNHDKEKDGNADGSAGDSLKVSPGSMPPSQSRHSFKSLLITEKAESMCKDKNPALGKGMYDDEKYKSANVSKTVGANPNYVKGPNDKLLLMDYVQWEGPNTDLCMGPQKSLAKGPDKNNLSKRQYKPFGPNSNLCKGAKPGLAKGSMFKQFRNIVIGESRGK